MLLWVHVSAVNDSDNVVFINMNTYWGTILKRSGMTEQKLSTRVLYNASCKHEAIEPTWLSLAAEQRLRIESSGRCQEYRVAGVAVSPQFRVCANPSELLPPEQEDGWGLAPGQVGHISLSSLFMWRILLSTLEIFVNHHMCVEWSRDFLGGAVF